MTESIQGFRSLSAFQVQQAFRPRARQDVQSLPQEDDFQSALEANLKTSSSKEVSPTKTSTLLSPPVIPFEDIQLVAKQVGLIGVTHKDIERAYFHGSSLFADYKA